MKEFFPQNPPHVCMQVYFLVMHVWHVLDAHKQNRNTTHTTHGDNFWPTTNVVSESLSPVSNQTIVYTLKNTPRVRLTRKIFLMQTFKRARCRDVYACYYRKHRYTIMLSSMLTTSRPAAAKPAVVKGGAVRVAPKEGTRRCSFYCLFCVCAADWTTFCVHGAWCPSSQCLPAVCYWHVCMYAWV